MHALPAVGVAALLVLAGHGFLRLVRYRASSGPEWLGLSFACGASIVGLATALLGALGAASGTALSVALLLPLASALLLRRTLERPSGSDRIGEGWFGFLPIALVVLFAFWLALQRPVWNIDALRRWVLHAQWLAEYGTSVPERVHAAEWSSTHPSYPPLVSGVMALALAFGADRDWGLRPLFPFFLLALSAVIYGRARTCVGARLSPWIALAFATTPCFLVLDRYGGAIGLGADAALADVPLALLLCTLAVLLVGAAAEPRRSTLWTAGAVAVGAVLTKNEGTLLAPLFLAAAWVALRASARGADASSRRAARAGVAGAFGAAVAAALLWRAIARGVPVEPGEAYVGGQVLAGLGGAAERLPPVLARLGAELVSVRVWGLLWALPLVWVARCIARRTRPSPVEALLPLLLLLGLAVVVGAYLVTGWKGGNFSLLMDVSLTRLLMQIAPLAALVACEALAASAEDG